MIGRRVPEQGCTCVGRLVWSTITVVESGSRPLRPQFSQARRTDPTHPTKGFRQIGGCPEPTLNAPVRRTVPRSCDPAGTEPHLGGSFPLPSFISTVRVRNSLLPTFSSECGISGAPQTAVPKIGGEFDTLVSASTFPSGSRRTKSLVTRMSGAPTPPVGVHRHCGTRRNTSIEHPDPAVLEENCVEAWRSDHGVEVIGPRPRGKRAGDGQRDAAIRSGIVHSRYSRGILLSCLVNPPAGAFRL